jgi:hypothetical protein
VLLLFIFLANVILVLRSSCFDLRAWAKEDALLRRSCFTFIGPVCLGWE